MTTKKRPLTLREVHAALNRMLASGVDPTLPLGSARTKGLTGLLTQFEVDTGLGLFTINSNTAERFAQTGQDDRMKVWMESRRIDDGPEGCVK